MPNFAPCCLGNACKMMRKESGEFPHAAISRRCVSCDGAIHPLCGETNSNSSLLTCLGCFKQYGRSFEGKDDFEYFVGGGDWFEQQVGYDTGTTTTTIKQSEHDRLVEETKKKMLPDECPKLNRAQSTRDNNRNEVVKLIMWLLLGHKNESDKETRDRQMSLINPILSSQIHVAITDDQGISQKKREAAARVVIREWLDKENSPAPFDFSGMVYKDYTTYLSSNLKNNGVPLKGKVYMNKRSILNNLFKRHKFRASDEFSENVDKYMEGVYALCQRLHRKGLVLWKWANERLLSRFMKNR
jgi:hypothetical protein